MPTIQVRSRASSELYGPASPALLTAYATALAPMLGQVPVISGVVASGLTPSSITIGWNVAPAADGQVEYGTSTLYGSVSALDPTALSHSLTVSGLTVGQLYHYRVRSTNAIGQTTYSADGSFTIPAAAAFDESGIAFDSSFWTFEGLPFAAGLSMTMPAIARTVSPLSPLLSHRLLMSALARTTTAVAPSLAFAGSDPANAIGWTVPLRALFNNASYNGVVVPPGIYTGAQINTQIANVSNGTRLILAGCTINLTGDAGMAVANKSDFCIDGQGTCTVNQMTNGASNGSSAFSLDDCTRVSIRDLTVIGELNNVGTPASWNDINEHINGVMIRAGSSYIEAKNLILLRQRGWPLWSAGQDGSGAICDYMWWHGNQLQGGETFFTITAGTHGLVEDNVECQDATYFCIDFEPDRTDGHVRDWLIQRNTFRRWGWGGVGIDFLGIGSGFPGPNPPWPDAMRITVRDNLMPEGVLNSGGMRTRMQGGWPKQDIAVTGNVSGQPRTFAGGGVWIETVDNLTFSGNTQITLGHVPLVESDINGTGVHVITPNVT